MATTCKLSVASVFLAVSPYCLALCYRRVGRCFDKGFTSGEPQIVVK